MCPNCGKLVLIQAVGSSGTRSSLGAIGCFQAFILVLIAMLAIDRIANIAWERKSFLVYAVGSLAVLAAIVAAKARLPRFASNVLVVVLVFTLIVAMMGLGAFVACWGPGNGL
jgi:hypothetical protein